MRKSYSVSSESDQQDQFNQEKVLTHRNSQQHTLLRVSVEAKQTKYRRGSCKGDNMDPLLRSKFRGCLSGALVGDCIGTLFECDYSVSHSILGDLYISLTHLSEDEKLMDQHGIDFTLGPKKAQELLERKQRASMIHRPSTEGNSPPISPQEKRHSSLESRRGSFSRPIEKFSDDTVMTRSVAKSLIHMKGLDVKSVAKQLTEDYFLNLTRKYGAFLREIFNNLRDYGYSDPVGPAKKAMNNIGSTGNEAASRVAPVVLFAWHCEPSVIIDLASKQSKITNFNKSGVIGAVCQALAIHLALNWQALKNQEPSTVCQFFNKRNTPSPNPSPTSTRKTSNLEARENIPMKSHTPTDFDFTDFCLRILELIDLLETKGVSILENLKHFIHPNRDIVKNELSYSEKIRAIMEFLNRSEPPLRAEVVEKLGNSVKAIESVPTALYAFLISAKSENFPEIQVRIKSPVLRTIFYAISLGGDSDTIASMAGAIAGAFWGYEQIPQEILRVCEGSKETLKLADELFDACTSTLGRL